MEENPKDKQLRLQFEQAYYDWKHAPTWQEREIKWIEYTTIRDTYLGLSWSSFFWTKLKKDETS